MTLFAQALPSAEQKLMRAIFDSDQPQPTTDLGPLEAKIEQLKGRLYAVEETGGTTRDILLLLYFALSQSSALLLDSLLTIAPVRGVDTPLDLGGDFKRQIEEEGKFVEIVKRKLDNGADRRNKLAGVLMNAEWPAPGFVDTRLS